MSNEARDDKLREKIKATASIYLTEITSQIPAHANYIVTAIFGLTASLIALIVSLISASGISLETKIEYGFFFGILFILVPFGYFGLRSYAKLFQYILQTTILNEILGVCGESNQDYYLGIFEKGISGLKLTGLSSMVQFELLYRVKYGRFTFRVIETGDTVQNPEREKFSGIVGFIAKLFLRKSLSSKDNRFALNKLGEYHRLQCNTLEKSKHQ